MKTKTVCHYPVFWASSLAVLVSILTLLERNLNFFGIATSVWLNLPMLVVLLCAFILAVVDYPKLKVHRGRNKLPTA